VGIIERGQLLFSGTVEEIVRRAKMGHVLHVGVMDRHEDAGKALAKLPGVKKVALITDETAAGGRAGKVLQVTIEETPGAALSDIPSALITAGFRMTKFAEEPVNLETAFMRLTKGLVQ
jgi:ABC-2 type transport system ATP-binding protein